MSRFDDCCDEGVISPGLWKAITNKALGGKRGQTLLKELEQALIALPVKELHEGVFYQQKEDSPQGCVCCALGALARYRIQNGGLHLLAPMRYVKGRKRELDKSLRRTIRSEELLDAMTGHFADIIETIDIAEQMGMAISMAWAIAHTNDEVLYNVQPGDRYNAMLAWVRSRIHKEEEDADGDRTKSSSD